MKLRDPDANAMEVTPVTASGPAQGHWNHVRDARFRERLSLRTVAKRLGITASEAARREAPENDMRMSEIHAWSEALRVPPNELVFGVAEQQDAEISARACLVRTARLLHRVQKRVPDRDIRREAASMINEIIEAMPEVQSLLESWSSTSRGGEAFAPARSVTDLLRASRQLFRRTC